MQTGRRNVGPFAPEDLESFVVQLRPRRQDDRLCKVGGSAVFVKYYTHLERPFSDLVPAFTTQDLPLAERASDAYRHAERLTVRLSVGTGVLAKMVELEMKDRSAGPDQVVLAVSWTATGGTVLFPRMEADLKMQPLGPDLTQLSFEGSYEPPLGLPGAVLDRWALHRVAEVCVKNFVDRVAQDLDATADADDR